MPSIILQMYMALVVYTIFLPVMGRSGTISGDLYIAVVTSILTFYVTNFVVGLANLNTNSYTVHLDELKEEKIRYRYASKSIQLQP